MLIYCFNKPRSKKLTNSIIISQLRHEIHYRDTVTANSSLGVRMVSAYSIEGNCTENKPIFNVLLPQHLTTILSIKLQLCLLHAIYFNLIAIHDESHS